VNLEDLCSALQVR